MAAADPGEEEGIKEPWAVYLDDQLQDFEEGSVNAGATIVIRDVLAANNTNDATFKEAAIRLDKYDDSVHLTYDPLKTIVHAARLIPYNDEKQDRLIKLLNEMMALSRPGSDYKESLSGILEKDWNGLFPTMRPSHDKETFQKVARQKCIEWLNYSVFKARTLAAGICADYDDWSFKAPSIDVPIGLRMDNDFQWDNVFKDCTLMVSVQYILIAGEVLRPQFTESEDSDGRWNSVLWKQWAERLREASNWDGVEEETKLAAKRAYDKMAALWPALFTASSSREAGN